MSFQRSWLEHLAPAGNCATSERTSGFEVAITRTLGASAWLVFEAWLTPEVFMQGWVPKSSGAMPLSRKREVLVGTSYRLKIASPRAASRVTFFGKVPRIGAECASRVD
jgi:hypothetical protein